MAKRQRKGNRMEQSSEFENVPNGPVDTGEDSDQLENLRDAEDAGEQVDQQPSAGEDEECAPVQQFPEEDVDDGDVQAPVSSTPIRNQDVLTGHRLARKHLNMTASVVEKAKKDLNFLADIDTSAISLNGKIVLETLQNYLIATQPGKPMNQTDGCRQQTVLYRALVSMINNLDNDFDLVFGAVLKVFRTYPEELSPIRVFRWLEHIQLHQTERQAFTRLLNLLTLLNDPKTWAIKIKQVDMTRTLSQPITDAGRQRVLNFYNV